MMNGIYGYWDNLNNYVAYIGQSGDINHRLMEHGWKCMYNEQKINQVIQNNPDRYEPFILADGDFTDVELDEMESQAIEIFKTFKYDYPERDVFNFTKGGDGFRGYKSPNKGENHWNYGNPNNITRSKESKIKTSKKMNKTGFFRVYIVRGKKYKKGFSFRYRFMENGDNIMIQDTSLKKLKEKVLAKGYDWIIIDEDKAKETLKLDK